MYFPRGGGGVYTRISLEGRSFTQSEIRVRFPQWYTLELFYYLEFSLAERLPLCVSFKGNQQVVSLSCKPVSQSRPKAQFVHVPLSEKNMSFSTVCVCPKRSRMFWALTTWYSMKSVVTELIFALLSTPAKPSH